MSEITPTVHLTVLERLQLVANVLGFIPLLVSIPFRRWHTPLLHRTRNLIICYLSELHYRLIQGISPSTASAYRSHRAKRKQPPIETLLPAAKGKETCRLLYLGADLKESGKVVLYLHGGGYMVPMGDAYWQFTEYLASQFAAKQKGGVTIAVLEYTLTPHASYPTQLSQASHALSHLIENRGVPASSIVIAGDSAGGHLALSLLSHILHPHPSVAQITLLSPLAGIILISPAVTWRTDRGASMQTNQTYDLLSRRTINQMAALFTEDPSYEADLAAGGYWGEMILSPTEWWEGMGKMVRKLLVTVGGRELFCDDVVEFVEGWKRAEVVKQGKVELEVVVGREEVHDLACMDFILPGGERSETTRRVAEVVGEMLG